MFHSFISTILSPVYILKSLSHHLLFMSVFPTYFSCIFKGVCAVTGSTVIDFTGKVHSVPDRCGYSLLKPLSIPGLQMVGVFKERRRKDVSFLESVILQLNTEGVQVSLEQGGRVLVSFLSLIFSCSTNVQ